MIPSDSDTFRIGRKSGLLRFINLTGTSGPADASAEATRVKRIQGLVSVEDRLHRRTSRKRQAKTLNGRIGRDGATHLTDADIREATQIEAAMRVTEHTRGTVVVEGIPQISARATAATDGDGTEGDAAHEGGGGGDKRAGRSSHRKRERASDDGKDGDKEGQAKEGANARATIARATKADRGTVAQNDARAET